MGRDRATSEIRHPARDCKTRVRRASTSASRGRFPPGPIGRLGLLILLVASSWTGAPALATEPGAEPGIEPGIEPRPPALREVRFEGRERFPDDVLREVCGLAPGEALTEEATRAAFGRLLGYPFLSRVAPPRLEAHPDGTADLIFRIEERRLLGILRFEGLRRLEETDLLRASGLRAGEPYREETIERARRAILQTYHRDGHLFAEANAVPEPAGAGRMDVRFLVREGPRVHLTAIVLEGTEGLAAADVLEDLEMRPRRLFGLLAKGTYVPEDIDAEIDRIRSHYVSRGFLSAVATLEGIEFDAGFREVRARFRVREGPRYVVSDVRVEGSKLFPEKLLLEAADLPAGGFFSGPAVEAARGRIVRWYEGHADRLPATEVRIRYGDRDDVAIVFAVREEKFLETGEVKIRGNRVTRERVIRSNVTIVPGEPFDRSELGRTVERIERTNLFRGVEIDVEETPHPGKPDTVRTDVTIAVEERAPPAPLFEVGGGAASGSGAVGYVAVHRANFDLFRFPRSWADMRGAFLGGGQSIDLHFIPGTRESEYAFRFEEPYLFRSDLSLSIRGGVRLYDRGAYDEDRVGGSIEVSKSLDRDRRWSASIGYVGDLVRVNDIETGAPADAVAAEGKTVIAYPRLGLRFDETDGNFYSGPAGLSASLRLDLADEAVGSDADFARAVASVDWFVPFLDEKPDDRHILHLGLRLRWMDSLSGGDVPLFERFYLGGPRTFRGFEYRRLGPHDGDTPVGGEGAIHGTVEYSFPIVRRELRAQAFLDWGDLEPGFSGIAADRFRAAVGAGLLFRLRLLGQVIPANLYWTHAFATRTGDATELFSFTLGVDL